MTDHGETGMTSEAAGPRRETLDLARREVRALLLRGPAFRGLPRGTRRRIAARTVRVAAYLAEPEGIRPEPGRAGGRSAPHRSPDVPPAQAPAAIDQEITAAAVRAGAVTAGALPEAVDFPAFVGGLIHGVFDAIVDASIRQMEAYGRLIAAVAGTVDQFQKERIGDDQARDWLVEQFAEALTTDAGPGVAGCPRPRVRVRAGVDAAAALRGVSGVLSVQGGPLTLLDDEGEGRLVQAARQRLAAGRQQLLATMVRMGINRIVVTDGRVPARVAPVKRASDVARRLARVSMNERPAGEAAAQMGSALGGWLAGSRPAVPAQAGDGVLLRRVGARPGAAGAARDAGGARGA